jgi:GDP-D-mannose 3', 5'-epimerase
MAKKTALVLGAGGFIGNQMVTRLKSEGYWVRGVDLKYPEFSETQADHFVIRDLRNPINVEELIGYAGCNRNPHQIFAMHLDVPFDEIYQFAADMGGAGYIFTGDNDAHIMHNSAMINLNLLEAVKKHNDRSKQNATKIFYSSSACIYPAYNQENKDNPICKESTAYPAAPDSEYGWEKLFSERLYHSYTRNYGIPTRVARYHNIYGPLGTYDGGREKAPAAICRKAALATDDSEIEIWGDGEQTRSFLYIADCIEATRRLMNSEFEGPVNIGSEEMVSINEMAERIIGFSGKDLRIRHVYGPMGVRGRNSDNRLIEEKLGWRPIFSLSLGLSLTYTWVHQQVNSMELAT